MSLEDSTANLNSGRLFCTGPYQITGTVTELGVVGAYKVRLFERTSGKIIDEVLSSSSDGSYLFENVAYLPNGYFVVAFDHGENASPQAGIVDLVTPDLMP